MMEGSVTEIGRSSGEEGRYGGVLVNERLLERMKAMCTRQSEMVKQVLS